MSKKKIFNLFKHSMFKKGPQQTHFPGLKPRKRKFKARVKFEGDARGIAIASSGIGVGAIGIGEGVRRSRSPKVNKKIKGRGYHG